MPNISGMPQQYPPSQILAAQANPVLQNNNYAVPQSPQVTTENGSSGNGVVINIYNPVGKKYGGTEAAPPAQPAQQSIAFPAAQKLDKTEAEKPESPAPIKKDEPKKPAQSSVPLTDDYIKTLENYLNSPNADVRTQGVKEVLKRFKEDDTRKNDVALTNLLNKSLQDPSQKVRLIALGALQGSYATGDPLTYKILQKIQKSKSSYNQDAVTASNILLQRAGQNLDVKTNNTEPLAQQSLQQPQQGQKLDIKTTNSTQPSSQQLQQGQNLNVTSSPAA